MGNFLPPFAVINLSNTSIRLIRVHLIKIRFLSGLMRLLVNSQITIIRRRVTYIGKRNLKFLMHYSFIPFFFFFNIVEHVYYISFVL